MSYGPYSRQPADDRPYRVAVGLVGLGLLTLVVALSDPTVPEPPTAPAPKAAPITTTATTLITHRAGNEAISHSPSQTDVLSCRVCKALGITQENVPAFASE